MSKGAYTFLSYPESSNIDEIKVALDSTNWDFEISPLHDKDVKEDGTVKKAHYHIICGFRRKVPEYKEFKAFVKSIGGHCPPYNDCIVHDVEELDMYLTHDESCKSAEGKVVYSDEDVFRSETWDIKAYISYTEKREKKHEKSSAKLQEIIKYISLTKCDFNELVDNFVCDSDSLSVIMSNAYALTQYIKCIK